MWQHPKAIAAAALATAIALSSAIDAGAAERRKSKRSYDDDRSSSREYRSSTVDRRGLCQRDNGRPLDSLSLNHRCDREEFWARMNDRGNDRR